MHGFWLLLHLLGVIVWVGGMFFAVFCLRPAIASLEPPQRAPLMTNALGRFFNVVLVSIAIIWVSGTIMYSQIGAKYAPLGWNVMIAIAILMTILFLIIRFALFPRVVAAIAGAQMPVAGQALEKIRILVLINLLLGILAVAAVSLLN